MPLSCRAPRWRVGEQLPTGAVTADRVRAIANAKRALQMLVNDDIEVGHGRANASRLNLKKQIGPPHRVVVVDDALMLGGEDTVQILTPQRDEGRSCLCSRPGELPVKLANVALSQKIVRRV